MPDDRPGLRAADVPAWRDPTPLARLEQALRGPGRPSPERRRLAEGVAGLGSMLPGPGAAEAMAMLRRGDDGDYLGGALGLLMAGGAGATGMSAARAAMARAKAARAGSLGVGGVGIPLDHLMSASPDGARSGGVLAAPEYRPPLVPEVDLDGRPINPYGDLAGSAARWAPQRGPAHQGFAGGGLARRVLDRLGLFSRAMEEAGNIPQAKGTGEQMRAALLKQGVKPDELTWTGFDDWAKDKKSVTRDEVADFLRRNQVQVSEVRSGNANPYPHTTPGEWRRAIRRAERAGDFTEAERLTLAWEAREGLGPAGATKFERFTLPGGANYRELRLTWPSARPSEEQARALLGAKPDAPLSPADIGHAARKAAQDYKSSHWSEPNVLAHLRLKDREVPTQGFAVVNRRSGNSSEAFASRQEAEAYLTRLPQSLRGDLAIVEAPGAPQRILHVEEIQSDWAQEGRRRGFETPERVDWRTRLQAAEAEAERANDAADAAAADVLRRRDLAEAAPGGAAAAQPPLWRALAHDPEVSASRRRSEAARRQADALRAQPPLGGDVPRAPFVEGTRQWTDLALKRALVEAAEGGYDALAWTPGAQQAARYPGTAKAGMVGYYDTIVPTRLKKLARELDPDAPFGTLRVTPRGDNRPVDLPALTLTPAMRDKIKQGLPLFTLAPGVMALPGLPSAFGDDLAAGEEAQANPPQGFAVGGQVNNEHIISFDEAIPLGQVPLRGGKMRRNLAPEAQMLVDDYVEIILGGERRMRSGDWIQRRPRYGIDPISENYRYDDEHWEPAPPDRYAEGGGVGLPPLPRPRTGAKPAARKPATKVA